jgi:hypothetical protein
MHVGKPRAPGAQRPLEATRISGLWEPQTGVILHLMRLNFLSVNDLQQMFLAD